MNKKYQTSLIGLFILFNITGQDLKKIDFQFDAGTTLSIPYKWSETYSSYFSEINIKRYNRINFGYYLESLIIYNFTDKFHLKTGVNYNLNRLKVKTIFNDSYTYNENLIFSHVNLPLILEYDITSYISISAGIQPSFLLEAKVNSKTEIDTSRITFSGNSKPLNIILDIPEKYNYKIKNNYDLLSLDLITEIDYKLLSTDEFSGFLFTRFNYGLTNILKEEINSKWKNYILIIGIGIKI